MKILITGANGTVGSDLVNFFSKNCKVYAIYRTSNKINRSMKSKNIFWIMHDLKRKINLNINPTVVIHCAVTHEFKKRNFIKDYVDSNIISLMNIVNFSKKKKIKKFFNFSSYAVYNANKLDILSITKIISENLIKKSNLNYLNLRLPGVLTYSLSDKRRPWLNNIINKLRLNKKIEIYNGNKSFNSVIDTFEIYKFIYKQIGKNKLNNDIFNLTASKPIKLSKVVKYLKHRINSKSNIVYLKKNKKDFKITNPKNKIKYQLPSTRLVIDRFLDGQALYEK
tara:strand:- start:2195 stop:3037 length:843 start_codon:yes stop_codon:yes gene_type:complete